MKVNEANFKILDKLCDKYEKFNKGDEFRFYRCIFIKDVTLYRLNEETDQTIPMNFIQGEIGEITAHGNKNGMPSVDILLERKDEFDDRIEVSVGGDNINEYLRLFNETDILRIINKEKFLEAIDE
jgi:hypothetical protein